MKISPHFPRLLTALIALVASVLLIAACGDDEGDPGGEAEVTGDAELTVYSGRDEDLVGPVIADAGVETEVRYGDSAPLASTIVEEGESSPADVFFSQDAGALGALDDRELLEPLPKRILNRVPEELRAEDGTWVGVTGRARVIAYGSEVERSELPDSPLDLVESEWTGRVGWAPANASLQAYVTAVRESLGEDVAREWLEGMVANDTQVYENNTAVRDAIANGEVDVGLVNHYYVAQAQAELGPDYPVEVFYPPEGLGSLINVAGVGILQSSESKQASLELIDYLLSRDAQQYFVEETKEYPLIEGLEPDPELVPLARIPAPGIDLGSIDDLEGTLALMRETGAL